MFTTIRPEEFDPGIVKWIHPSGVILLAGEGEKANPMTVSWGHFGVMWNRPVFIVHVRPTRHTYQLMETGMDFTINSFDPERSDVLDLSGRKSGRDMNKIEALGLDLIPSIHVKTPSIMQANTIVECRILYKDTIKPELFMDPSLEKLYPRKDYHTSYWGEVLQIRQKKI